jgi:glycosyltransferase involved in cell wall biosynthesis
MADKLLQILESEDLIKRMGEQSKLIAKQYSEKNQAKIVLGLYEKLKEKYDHRIVL